MNLPCLSNVARVADRAREKEHPPHPTDLDFSIIADAIPENFLRSDLQVGKQRHLIFSTDAQLCLLNNSNKRWYIWMGKKAILPTFLYPWIYSKVKLI